MKRHLFITGPSGCGKTTLLKNELGSLISYAGGFITSRMIRPDGSTSGCELLPAAALADRGSFEGCCFLDFSHDPPIHDNEVFRSFGAQLLRESIYYPFVLLEEIGGFELLIPQFRRELETVLNSDRPVIGVLKSKDNARQVKESVGLGDRFTLMTENLHSVLSSDPDTAVLDMEKLRRDDTARIVRRWAEKYLLP